MDGIAYGTAPHPPKSLRLGSGSLIDLVLLTPSLSIPGELL